MLKATERKSSSYRKWHIALTIVSLASVIFASQLLLITGVIEAIIALMLALVILALGGGAGIIHGWFGALAAIGLVILLSLVLPFHWNIFLYSVAALPIIFLPTLFLTDTVIFKRLYDLINSDNPLMQVLGWSLVVTTMTATLLYAASGIIFALGLFSAMGLFSILTLPTQLVLAMPVIWIGSGICLSAILIGLELPHIINFFKQKSHHPTPRTHEHQSDTSVNARSQPKGDETNFPPLFSQKVELTVDNGIEVTGINEHAYLKL